MYIIPQLAALNNEAVVLLKVSDLNEKRTVDLCCSVLKKFEKTTYKKSADGDSSLLADVRNEIFNQLLIHSIPYKALRATTIVMEENYDQYN